MHLIPANMFPVILKPWEVQEGPAVYKYREATQAMGRPPGECCNARGWKEPPEEAVSSSVLTSWWLWCSWQLLHQAIQKHPSGQGLGLWEHATSSPPFPYWQRGNGAESWWRPRCCRAGGLALCLGCRPTLLLVTELMLEVIKMQQERQEGFA